MKRKGEKENEEITEERKRTKVVGRVKIAFEGGLIADIVVTVTRDMRLIGQVISENPVLVSLGPANQNTFLAIFS